MQLPDSGNSNTPTAFRVMLQAIVDENEDLGIVACLDQAVGQATRGFNFFVSDPVR